MIKKLFKINFMHMSNSQISSYLQKRELCLYNRKASP